MNEYEYYSGPLRPESNWKRFSGFITRRLLGRLSGGNPRVNYWLFVATCFSTFLTGWAFGGKAVDGMWYGGAIMIILLAHEMGHYLMCRKYHVNATLPYFIPFPLTPFGTLGAVIRMQAMLPSRKALFDVAVAGPLAGLFFTIPAIFWGAKLSTFEPFTGETGGVIYLAEPFFFSKIVELSIGSPLEGQNMAIHPLAYAGWAGLFVTALNLLPIGQLDGGHVIYALFGRQHGVVATIALICFALITIFVFHGWILMLALLIFFGRKHPPTLDERPIDLKRKIIGFMMMAIFLLSFAPEPIKFLD